MRDIDNTYSRFLVEWRLQCVEVERDFLEDVRKQSVRGRTGEKERPPQTLHKVMEDDQPLCELVLAWAGKKTAVSFAHALLGITIHIL